MDTTRTAGPNDSATRTVSSVHVGHDEDFELAGIRSGHQRAEQAPDQLVPHGAPARRRSPRQRPLPGRRILTTTGRSIHRQIPVAERGVTGRQGWHGELTRPPETGCFFVDAVSEPGKATMPTAVSVGGRNIHHRSTPRTYQPRLDTHTTSS